MFRFEVIETETHKEVSIGGELTIYCAEDLFTNYVKSFSTDKHVLLRLDEVEEVDTSGIQILLMLKKQIKSKGHNISLGPVSKCVERYVSLFDLTSRFDAADWL
ncbi:hypothetical protein OLMES_2870 [Oleiphilus messinensis]|uniref:STAS domain-containing protein n=1 Tax=Oleiphilus messinensis TaxID=141451 RepID=A0A1Y0I8U6_9GAMM|nr:STAS domain-containing protein [Oleiphilus messinensis]ARU56918.1 hypothetical protein OLMES_2870 [Oleiphilus messinensis]